MHSPTRMDDEKLVRVLKALADHRRFELVRKVAAAGELSCGELGATLGLSQPTVSHHLKLLVEAGVLRMRQDARHHFLSVDHLMIGELGKLLPARLRLPAPGGRRKPAPVRRAAARK